MKGFLQKLWNGWKVVARRIGEFQSRLLLTVLYVVLVGPIATFMRLFSDPLRLRRVKGDSYWLKRESIADSLERSRRQ